jgi:hypothetical protein
MHRRCKSFDDLQKHFRQLHEREHQKKLRGPKKAAAKYHTSDKAQRVRWASRARVVLGSSCCCQGMQCAGTCATRLETQPDCWSFRDMPASCAATNLSE